MERLRKGLPLGVSFPRQPAPLEVAAAPACPVALSLLPACTAALCSYFVSERPDVHHAAANALAVLLVSVVDAGSTAWARRFSQVVVSCHGATQAEGGSFATIVSAIRLIAASVSDRIGRAAVQRADLIAEIHEELGDEEA
jgi:hypothetical protein